MGLAHFSIGTATNRLDLTRNLKAIDWEPSQTPLEPTWASSALAEGRRPTSHRFTNAVESMTLHIVASSQDKVIEWSQELRRTLVKATEYWDTDYQPDIVYVAARASCETNMRYCWVYGGEVPKDSDPYGQPFTGHGAPSFWERQLVFERGAWLDNVPGTGTSVTIAAPYMANKWNSAQITNIHYWDSNTNTWSGNLAGLTGALLPNPVLIDDLVVFGIDSLDANFGPFCSLVFDIGTAGTPTITWKYSDVAGADPTTWAAMAAPLFQDNTNQDGLGGGIAFDTLGVRSVHWPQNALWIVQDPTIGGVALGVTGLWICADVTGGAGGVPPVQQNTGIYTIIDPVIDLAQPGGDMQTLVRFRARNESTAQQARLVAGLRKTARGTDFRSFINFVNAQNALGITVAIAGGAAFSADVTQPTGSKIFVAAPGVPFASYAYVTLAQAYSLQYMGRYHMFLRANQLAGAAGIIRVRVNQYIGDASYYEQVWSSGIVAMTTVANVEALDMGLVEVPGIPAIESFTLYWEVEISGDAAVNVDLIDMAIIPIDEWAVDIDTQYLFPANRSAAAYMGFYADVDGITYPKKIPRAKSYPFVTGSLHAGPRLIGGRGGLIPNVTQQLHVLTMSGSATTWTSLFYAAESLEAWQAQRYSSMRGAR